jgi:hypothetical protein
MPALRKPRNLNPLVPTHALDYHLARIYVGAADADVVAHVEEAIASEPDPRWTPAIRRQTIRYALWRHHRNYAEYIGIVSGRVI